MMKARSLTAALLLTLSSGPALAQAEPPRAPRMPPRRAPPTSPGSERPAPRGMSKADRDAALTAIAAALRESYVFPEKVPAIIERLEQSRKAGRYDLEDAGVLSERITVDLQAASSDRHLYLNHDPVQYAAEQQRAEHGTPDEAAGPDELLRREALRDHHGLSEMKLLPGNLRYLRITGFEWVRDETGTVYDDAMRFLKDGDAIIIDLRGNGGGEHAAVRYLVSHFLDGDVLELTFLAGKNPPVQSRTLEHVPAGRLKGKPLYVLIDGNVASAGEAFAYDVAQFKLGELVGAKTVGAANNNRYVPIRPGFVLSVSFGRPVHAISNTNWEGVGVLPTVEAPPTQALETAQLLALKRLSEAPGVSPEALADYEWARLDVEARLRPTTVPVERLKSLAGRYGDFEVALREGSLWMMRPGRPDRRLSPLTADGLFAVDGSDMLRVRFKPKTMETLWRGAPAPRVYPRS
ncbi:S41 family peptidase [Pyxidicoccus parkwayensis]|uniref:S41 family peptidase n=1 Tax=Pyxidicoccus parkwayensis TaxID=2813578 RepID=A0ABX7NW36_9BACT|nr:S41 family peptidase [Pyxidicoccus parkwaysis]QSQ21682.1 S41 family peptidase [Pyxidicoccus parkwaysis]